MVDVFISYSKTNEAVVRRLADAVKRLGYSVWWDDELPPHLSYSDVITDKIGSAKAAIVVWSEGAAASEWVRAEADVARAQKKLIQTSIDGRMPPMPFNQIQFAAIGDWQGEEDHPGWTKVKASLAALCGPPDGESAPPIPAPQPTRSAPPVAAPVSSGRSALLVPALLGLLVLVMLAIAYLLWSRGGGQSTPPPANAMATATVPAVAPAPSAPAENALPPAAATDGTFTEAATLAGTEAFADLRGGPSADALTVGRINRAEVFTTFPQSGDWWRVRTANGTMGYLAHAQIRVIPVTSPAPAPALQHQQRAVTDRQPAAPPPQEAAPVRPAPTAQSAKPGGPVPLQVQNMRRFCNGGPGQGTPQCIQFHQRMARQQAMHGGYR
jgi:hypothetical protein